VNHAVVSAGSNIDPQKNIPAARKLISRSHCLHKQSAVITTEPIGYAFQPDFSNTVFLIETELSRPLFRQYLKSIELRLGRTRSANRNGPRTIDLDIAIWNGTVVDDDVRNRAFLRALIEEVLPGFL
jgi:2-amino-4-hydroxy-6-hydroxymethyldihydropteridine diphosphokinase